MGIEIKDLPAVVAAEIADVIPAMRSTTTKRITLEQVSDLVIARLTTSAPAALDTWLELVAQIEGNEDGLADLVTAVGLKADAADTDTPTLTAKTTPDDSDLFRIWDVAGSAWKKLTWANLKAAVFTASGAAPVYAARSWGLFTGTTTAVILESGNVASITRSATGQYDVVFTTAMPDANYAVMATAREGGFIAGINTSRTAAGFTIRTSTDAGAFADSGTVNFVVFR